MKKGQLLNGQSFEFTNDEDGLECFFSEKLNKFCLIFNAKFESFKTFDGFKNRTTTLIEKFGLTELQTA